MMIAKKIWTIFTGGRDTAFWIFGH